MALSQFPAAFDRLTGALSRTASVLRTIQSGTGDLPVTQIKAAQDGLHACKDGAIRAGAEIAKRPADAEAHMQALSGLTLAQFGAYTAQMETEASAWGAALDAALVAAGDAMQMRVLARDTGGVVTRQLVAPEVLPAAQADPLRAGSALAALVTALDEIGA